MYRVACEPGPPRAKSSAAASARRLQHGMASERFSTVTQRRCSAAPFGHGRIALRVCPSPAAQVEQALHPGGLRSPTGLRNNHCQCECVALHSLDSRPGAPPDHDATPTTAIRHDGLRIRRRRARFQPRRQHDGGASAAQRRRLAWPASRGDPACRRALPPERHVAGQVDPHQVAAAARRARVAGSRRQPSSRQSHVAGSTSDAHGRHRRQPGLTIRALHPTSMPRHIAIVAAQTVMPRHVRARLRREPGCAACVQPLRASSGKSRTGFGAWHRHCASEAPPGTLAVNLWTAQVTCCSVASPSRCIVRKVRRSVETRARKPVPARSQIQACGGNRSANDGSITIYSQFEAVLADGGRTAAHRRPNRRPNRRQYRRQYRLRKEWPWSATIVSSSVGPFFREPTRAHGRTRN